MARLSGPVTAIRLLCAALLVSALVSVRAAAQGGTATLSGRVTDRSTGKAVAGARVALRDATRSTLSDSSGDYKLTRLSAGATQVVVRAAHFPELNIVVELLEGQVTRRPVRLDSTPLGRLAAARALPAVEVSAAAPAENYRLVAFEERRRTGRGQYLTEEQIDRSGAYNVNDAVRNLRGVTYECGGPGIGVEACHVRMSRAPMRCMPEWVVDGQTDNDFGSAVPIRDIVGIEVYTGPSDVPGEFAGRNAGCGVIVIWTRAGPDKGKGR